ncbi:response regulator [Constantimarinum furrinae]|nr:response regulator [Constantimarinum furrinae]
MPKSISFLFFLCLLACIPSLIAQGTEKTSSDTPKIQDSLKVIELHNSFTAIVDERITQSQFYLDTLQDIFTQTGSTLSNYYYHQDLGYLQFIKHDLESSVVHYKTAREIAKSNGWQQLEIASMIWLANHLYFQNETDTARSYYTTILNESAKIHYVDGIATGFTGLSYLTQDEEEVLTYLIKVDSVYHHYDTISPILSNAYGNIGKIYLDTYHNRNEAWAYFNRSFEMARKLNYVAGLRYMDKLLGEMALTDGNYEKAYHHFNSSYDLALEYNDTIEIARGLLNLSAVDLETGDAATATIKLQKALPMFTRLKDTVSMFYTRLSFAKSELMQNRSSVAKKHLDSAYSYKFHNPPISIKIDLLEAETEYYKAVGDYKTALEKQQAYDSLISIRTDQRNSDAFLALEKRYDTKKKEQEIALLRSKNELVESQKKNQRNILTGLLILAFLAGIIFFILYRNRQITHHKLQQLDKAKSTFFANISHEFKTPLTLIKGPLEDQIHSEKITVDQRKMLQTAHKNTVRLENLVSQLLALSKLESGHFKLKVQPGNFPAFLAALTEAFDFSSKEKNITLTSSINQDDSVDWFDRDALEKVIFNLLGNAIKYTSEGGSIGVHGERTGTNYTFTVKNTGSYISATALNNLFERFYQTHPQNPGTGIGLALTKELLDLHHGSIKVQSYEEGITAFSVSIPVSKEEYSQQEQLEESLQLGDEVAIFPSEAQSSHTSLTNEDAPLILIADDHQELRDYIASVFESEFRIVTASNGEIAFKLAKEEVPDIIISDVMMPGINGYELTQLCKTDEVTSHIPIILLTAKTEDQDKLTGIESGADAYIPKPFNSRLLKARVSNLLESRRKLQQRFSREVILTPKEIAISSTDEQFLDRLQSVLEKHITDPSFSADLFCSVMAMSRMQLHRKLKALSGQSTSEFLRTQRLKLAASLLKQKKNTVADVAYACGFNDPSYFGKCFKQEFGCTPTEYISA